MCYSCGCGKAKEDHGDPRHITEKTFKDAAQANGSTVDDAKQNTLNLLKKELKSEEAA